MFPLRAFFKNTRGIFGFVRGTEVGP